jgi:hypothetical protein
MSLPVIDDLSRPFPQASSGGSWELLSDRVMGGVSSGTLVHGMVAGRAAIRMRGQVSLENNGGFIQMALDLSPGGAPVNCSRYGGIILDVCGNDESYGLHLRTVDLARPWQSYRQAFHAGSGWRRLELPFSGFQPHRTEIPLDLTRVKRVGLVAIGRAFAADLAVGAIAFY